MIIVMQKQASEQSITTVVQLIREHGLHEHISRGIERTIIGAVGDERVFLPEEFEALPQVERAMRVVNEWRIVGREVKKEDTVIKIKGVSFGGDSFLTILSNPINEEEIIKAHALYLDLIEADTKFSIYQQKELVNQEYMLHTLFDKAHHHNKPVLFHLRDIRQLDMALKYGVDMLYLGAEFIGNRLLLDEVRQLNIPLVLEKGRQHTAYESLLSAEYIALGGNHQLLFCESGTLHFDPQQPLRLDIEAILTLKAQSHLPVLVNTLSLGSKDVTPEHLHKIIKITGANGVLYKRKN
ncbi:chorismate mutase [Neisseria sp. Ec49-e6-T10]|uniref:chorismate mutase n=1 Tax=Neisseria sp. Ec49-e6-T10 TaxID=3140744 RepID=UPI003EBA7D29